MRQNTVGQEMCFPAACGYLKEKLICQLEPPLPLVNHTALTHTHRPHPHPPPSPARGPRRRSRPRPSTPRGAARGRASSRGAAFGRASGEPPPGVLLLFSKNYDFKTQNKNSFFFSVTENRLRACFSSERPPSEVPLRSRLRVCSSLLFNIYQFKMQN